MTSWRKKSKKDDQIKRQKNLQLAQDGLAGFVSELVPILCIGLWHINMITFLCGFNWNNV